MIFDKNDCFVPCSRLDWRQKNTVCLPKKAAPPFVSPLVAYLQSYIPKNILNKINGFLTVSNCAERGQKKMSKGQRKRLPVRDTRAINYHS